MRNESQREEEEEEDEDEDGGEGEAAAQDRTAGHRGAISSILSHFGQKGKK